MKKYILVDTNNFIEPFESGYKTTQLDKRDLEELFKLIENGELILLLPEIITLECDRLYKEKRDELTASLKEQKDKISIDAAKTKETLHRKIDQVLLYELEELKNIKKVLDNIFSHKNTRSIVLEPQIYINAYKRGLTGTKPFNKNKSKLNSGFIVHAVQPDCLLIESAKIFLLQYENKEYKLFVCSKDSDFRQSDGNKIHEDIEREFCKIKLYSTIREFLISEYKLDLPLPSTDSRYEMISKENNGESKSPPVPVDALIKELEYSASFDQARKNMDNLLSYRIFLTRSHLEKILKAMISNPNSYTINQVLAVDNEQEFTKKLFLYFKNEEWIWNTWKDFADSLILYFDEKASYLEDYNWLFKRLGMKLFHKNEGSPF